MAVRNTEPGGKVHKGQKGGMTGCGENTRDNPNHWENTTLPITCNKDGCKN